MTNAPRRNKSVLTAVRRVSLAAVTGVIIIALTGCGKTITIGDSAPPAAPAEAPAATTPAAAEPTAAVDPPVGNTALQVLDTTAAENGKTGTGGTTIGIAIQQTPPKWVQMSAVTTMALEQPHLVNINEATLYRFEKDSINPSQSNCDGDCATQWPPVTLQEGGSVFLDGVADDQVSGIRRSDGQIQLTVGGSPVYRFTGDSEPGDLKGQGVDGVWFAVGPTGEAVK